MHDKNTIISVYALVCPMDSKIKYIGISEQLETRYKTHIVSPMKCTKEWIYQLKSSNIFPIMKELERVVGDVNARNAEKIWINKIESEQGGLLNVRKTKKHQKHNLPEIQYLNN